METAQDADIALFIMNILARKEDATTNENKR